MKTATRDFAKQANLAAQLNAQRTISQNTLDTTVLVEHSCAPVIRCKAKESFKKGILTVEAGQEFFLVQSSKFPTRYYVVAWNAERHCWQCSCYSCCKLHAHTTAVNGWVKGHVVSPKAATKQDAVAAKVAECVEELREIATTHNDAPAPKTAEEWKAALKRQKEADGKYWRAYHKAAREVAQVSA